MIRSSFEIPAKRFTVRSSQGSGEVVVHNCEQTLHNWCDTQKLSEECGSALFAKVASFPVAVLKSLYVPEEERGTGHGSTMLAEVIERTAACSALILLCDLTESNAFDLQAWYEANGFRLVLESERSNVPVMILRN